MIEVKGLYKGYGDAPYVVSDINMKVERGTIHGLIGHNGSGKTTIIKCLTGIFPADQGDVLIDGESVYNNVKIKEQIGYVADTNQMFRGFSMKKMARFYEQIIPTFSMEDFVTYADSLGIAQGKKVSQLSKGQQMKAAFALNLARHPKVMILDEPTAGLDAMAKKELLDSIVLAVENEELTVLISSHHLSELEKICDNITMIRNGRVQIEDALDEVTGQIVKYQVVFSGGAPTALYEHPALCHISNVGSVYTVVLRHGVENFEKEMTEMGAALVEEMPVGLEESFIYMNKNREWEEGVRDE